MAPEAKSVQGEVAYIITVDVRQMTHTISHVVEGRLAAVGRRCVVRTMTGHSARAALVHKIPRKSVKCLNRLLHICLHYCVYF